MQDEELAYELDAKNQAERAKQVPSNLGTAEDRVIADYNLRETAKLVGLDVSNMYDNKDKLEFLLEWGREKSDSEDIVDALYEIKQLKDSLGFPEIGKTAIEKLYTYIRLAGEQDSLFKRLKTIKKEKELLKDGFSTPR